jgi:Pyruvate/2-oxoacid:ferredoxin oxidoreductase delta subunit
MIHTDHKSSHNRICSSADGTTTSFGITIVAPLQMSSTRTGEYSVLEEMMKDDPKCIHCQCHWCICDEKKMAQDNREAILREIALKSIPRK